MGSSKNISRWRWSIRRTLAGAGDQLSYHLTAMSPEQTFIRRAPMPWRCSRAPPPPSALRDLHRRAKKRGTMQHVHPMLCVTGKSAEGTHHHPKPKISYINSDLMQKSWGNYAYESSSYQHLSRNTRSNKQQIFSLPSETQNNCLLYNDMGV